MANKSFVFRFDDVEVRSREFSLIKAGKVLTVEPKAFRVLLILLNNPQKLVAKEELISAVWGDTAVSDGSLTRSIWLLRRLLGDDTNVPRYIETVATVGYRLVCKVEVSESTSGDAQEVERASNPRGGSSVEKLEVKAAEAHRRLWPRLLPSTVFLAIGLAAAIWYLHRPLPPLRVAEYTPITHEGRRIFTIAGTDGSRLYFNWQYGPPTQPNAEVAISGGGTVPVQVALPLSHIKDVSPDGSALLVSSSEGGRGSLWNVEIPGGSLRQILTDAPGIASAAWSPDGKFVVYSPGNGNLVIIRSDGTGLRTLATPATPGSYPNWLSWSPDGSRIRFSANNRLWEISSDGSALHQLLPGWHPESSQCCGRWSADGKFFVFQLRDSLFGRYGTVPGSQLWVIDERRGLFRRTPTEPVQLTSGPIRWNNPIPSKDGTKIFANGVIDRGELVRYDAQSRQFQPYLGGISAEFVAFSPDGQSVVYVTYPEGILWRANRDGSLPVQLIEAPLFPVNPRWSPDGSQILFCIDDAKGLKAYVVSSQGGTPRLLLPDEPGAQSDPGWSPDGSKIVYSTLKEIGNFNSVLKILDLSTHKVTTLPGSEGMWSHRWSPNGRFISGAHDGSTGGVKIFDLETQRWSQLQIKGECSWQTWSSDSQSVYCSLLLRDPPGMFRARIAGGDPELVVDLKGMRVTGALTNWEGLDPSDTPILLRDRGTDDIYALTLAEK
jgi:Tol biopolymer transport system component/DNA-binding winged helix-turn-helix (wHTH) protein